MIERRTLPVLLLLSIGASLGGANEPTEPSAAKVSLFPESGRHHHPIATRNSEAQLWFDQTLKAQGKIRETELLTLEFERAWQRATPLVLNAY